AAARRAGPGTPDACTTNAAPRRYGRAATAAAIRSPTAIAVARDPVRRKVIAGDNSSVKALIVAIDGPSGAGKGTVARALAARLGYRHIDTGAMYRALAWKALHDGVDLADAARVAALGDHASFDVENGRITIDGHDVAARIRTPEIDMAAA